LGRRVRHLVQAGWTALTNGYLYGFISGRIYTGKTKALCVPGLNCYSCPGALGSCPIGSLQAVLGSQNYRMSFYVFGTLMVFGSLLGRIICGWLCPFGLVQDLLYKIPGIRKHKNFPGHKYLVWLKYVVLVLFVIVLPLAVTNIVGMGDPWFCKYICPSGTLFAGLPLITVNEGIRSAAAWQFVWKVALLIVFLVLSAKWLRPFCKYVCPLGAVYGLFNPIALYRMEVDSNKCITCGACKRTCGMDIEVWKDPNSRECIRCGECKHICPKGAIKSGILIQNEQKMDKKFTIMKFF